MQQDKIQYLISEWDAACDDVFPTLDEKRRALGFLVGRQIQEPQDGMTDADSRLDHITAFIMNACKVARGRLARYGNEATPSK